MNQIARPPLGDYRSMAEDRLWRFVSSGDPTGGKTTFLHNIVANEMVSLCTYEDSDNLRENYLNEGGSDFHDNYFDTLMNSWSFLSNPTITV